MFSRSRDQISQNKNKNECDQLERLSQYRSKIKESMTSLKKEAELYGLSEEDLNSESAYHNVQYKAGKLEEIGRKLFKKYNHNQRKQIIINTYQDIKKLDKRIYVFEARYKAFVAINQDDDLKTKKKELLGPIKKTENLIVSLLKDARTKRQVIHEEITPSVINVGHIILNDGTITTLEELRRSRGQKIEKEDTVNYQGIHQTSPKPDILETNDSNLSKKNPIKEETYIQTPIVETLTTFEDEQLDIEDIGSDLDSYKVGSNEVEPIEVDSNANETSDGLEPENDPEIEENPQLVTKQQPLKDLQESPLIKRVEKIYTTRETDRAKEVFESEALPIFEEIEARVNDVFANSIHRSAKPEGRDSKWLIFNKHLEKLKSKFVKKDPISIDDFKKILSNFKNPFGPDQYIEQLTYLTLLSEQTERIKAKFNSFHNQLTVLYSNVDINQKEIATSERNDRIKQVDQYLEALNNHFKGFVSYRQLIEPYQVSTLGTAVQIPNFVDSLNNKTALNIMNTYQSVDLSFMRASNEEVAESNLELYKYIGFQPRTDEERKTQESSGSLTKSTSDHRTIKNLEELSRTSSDVAKGEKAENQLALDFSELPNVEFVIKTDKWTGLDSSDKIDLIVIKNLSNAPLPAVIRDKLGFLIQSLARKNFEDSVIKLNQGFVADQSSDNSTESDLDPRIKSITDTEDKSEPFLVGFNRFESSEIKKIYNDRSLISTIQVAIDKMKMRLEELETELVDSNSQNQETFDITTRAVESQSERTTLSRAIEDGQRMIDPELYKNLEFSYQRILDYIERRGISQDGVVSYIDYKQIKPMQEAFMNENYEDSNWGKVRSQLDLQIAISVENFIKNNSTKSGKAKKVNLEKLKESVFSIISVPPLSVPNVMPLYLQPRSRYLVLKDRKEILYQGSTNKIVNPNENLYSVSFVDTDKTYESNQIQLEIANIIEEYNLATYGIQVKYGLSGYVLSKEYLYQKNNQPNNHKENSFVALPESHDEDPVVANSIPTIERLNQFLHQTNIDEIFSFNVDREREVRQRYESPIKEPLGFLKRKQN
ncbi:MAG: hypothetical protein ACRCXZ_08265 [Patescibacteria group bacterium]